MNLVRLLLLPWWATPRRARGWIGGILALIALIFLIAFVFGQMDSDDSFGILVSFNVVAWVALLPNLMVLARNARALRLPAIERDAVRSLLVHALLLIVLPGMLVPITGLSAVQTTLAVALCAALAMAYASLPGYLALVIVFGWIFVNSIGKKLFVAVAARNAFTLWAACALAALLLAIVWSWRRVIRGNVATDMMQAPMILKFRMNAWSRSRAASIAQERQRPDWLRPQADLRHCSPENPPRSIRVALGGLFLPQRWQGHLRNWALLVLCGSFVVVVIGFQSWMRHPAHLGNVLWRIGLFATLAWGVGFGACLLAFLSVQRLFQLWQNVNGDLPLLALLPRVNGRPDLLRAILVPPLGSFGLLLVLSLACALALRLHAQGLAFVLLTQFGALGFFVAFALSILGGRFPPRWIAYLLGIAAFALVNVSLFAPAASDMTHGTIISGAFAPWLFGAWAGLALVLLWLGRRGWVGLHERPHPFLPNSA